MEIKNSFEYCDIFLSEKVSKEEVTKKIKDFKDFNLDFEDGVGLVTKIKLVGVCDTKYLFEVLHVLFKEGADEVIWETPDNQFENIRVFNSGNSYQKEMKDYSTPDVVFLEPDENFNERLENFKKEMNIDLNNQDIKIDIDKLFNLSEGDNFLILQYIQSLPFGYKIVLFGEGIVPIVAWLILFIMNNFKDVSYESR